MINTSLDLLQFKWNIGYPVSILKRIFFSFNILSFFTKPFILLRVRL